MKQKKLLVGAEIAILLAVAVFAIVKFVNKNNAAGTSGPDAVENVEKQVIINIQPLDGIQNVDQVVKDFDNKFLKGLGFESYKVNVLPHKNSPDTVFNAAHTRFDAKKLLMYVHDNTPQGEFTVGITNKDIATARLGHQDYGILGLSFLGGKKRACVTSTYRLKHKDQLWKLMAHEFAHGFFGQPHCTVDDDLCIMQDAKGKNPKFESKPAFCSVCRDAINRKIHDKKL